MAEQINATVSFVAAKKLAEAGYDQKNYIGLWYFGNPNRGLIKLQGDTLYYGPVPEWNAIKPYAALTHIQALMFFEQEKGYVWHRERWPKMQNRWQAYSPAMVELRYAADIKAPDPDSLILAIIDHMEERDGGTT